MCLRLSRAARASQARLQLWRTPLKRLVKMNRYPAPAQPIVAEMEKAAAAAPQLAVAFQGAPGANSHIAVLQDQPAVPPVSAP